MRSRHRPLEVQASWVRFGAGAAERSQETLYFTRFENKTGEKKISTRKKRLKYSKTVEILTNQFKYSKSVFRKLKTPYERIRTLKDT